MKFFKTLLNRNKTNRRIKIQAGGFWYLSLCIGLGVSAIFSGNNIIYLLDSILLSGFALSGILSERSINKLEIDIYKTQAIAGENCFDLLEIKNNRSLQIFDIEISEWKNNSFEHLIKIPFMDKNKHETFFIKRSFPSRGIQSIDGYAISTSFPFGLAKKIRLVPSPGTRYIWPQKTKNHADSAMLYEPEISDKLRIYHENENAKLIHWPSSSKTGTLIGRDYSNEKANSIVILTPSKKHDEMENIIHSAANRFHYHHAQVLIIKSEKNEQLSGKTNALNRLATL